MQPQHVRIPLTRALHVADENIYVPEIFWLVTHLCFSVGLAAPLDLPSPQDFTPQSAGTCRVLLNRSERISAAYRFSLSAAAYARISVPIAIDDVSSSSGLIPIL